MLIQPMPDIFTPPPERGNRIACVCPSIHLSVCVQDYAKSNARISLKFCTLIRNYRRTNPLNLGYDLDLIRDVRSGSNFQTGISRKKNKWIFPNFCTLNLTNNRKNVLNFWDDPDTILDLRLLYISLAAHEDVMK